MVDLSDDLRLALGRVSKGQETNIGLELDMLGARIERPKSRREADAAALRRGALRRLSDEDLILLEESPTLPGGRQDERHREAHARYYAAIEQIKRERRR